jgi:hypothetical protein
VSLCKEASSGLSSIDPSLFLGCGSSPGDAPPPAVVRMGVKDSLLDTAVAVPLVAVAACFAPDIARVVSKT